MIDDPRLIARRIVWRVLADASHSHPDPAVRAAAEAELLERHAATALAARRAGERLAESFATIGAAAANAIRPLVEFAAGFSGKGLA